MTAPVASIPPVAQTRIICEVGLRSSMCKPLSSPMSGG